MIVLSIFAFVVFVVIYYNVSYYLDLYRNAQKAKALGCKPMHRVANRLPFGLDQINIEKSAFDKHKYPYMLEETWAERAPVTTSEMFALGAWQTRTVDPVNIQAILAGQFADFDLGKFRQQATAPFLGQGIFTQDGAAWKHSREMLRPQFSGAQVRDLTSVEFHVQRLLDVLPRMSSVDDWSKEIDLQPLLFALSLDTSTEFLLGKSADSQLENVQTEKEVVKAKGFATAIDEATKGTSARFMYGPFSPYVFPKGWMSAVNIVHSTIDGIVSEALVKAQNKMLLDDRKPEEKRSRYVFLEELIKDTQDPIELRFQILNILIAGRDTTASSVSWAIFELVRQPQIYQRLRKIILHEFGTYSQCKPERDITFAKMKACSYLQYVINETLRLYPPLLVNTRVANKDTTLPRGGGLDGSGKVFIPKGRPVMYAVWVLHRNEALWGKDAQQFRPERWDGRKMGWDYVPFNGGPRICLGQQFAMTEMSYILIRLLQRFDKMENMDTSPIPLHNLGTTNCSANGVKVKLHEAEK
ncbi:Cytochrome P450 [Glarea lozoyensis ATCC 20868]|uniref:Cytochrome P450 n=1 Tax=Glarea lozoyensis (strain ATCC 20868 / MF5171) TaxID=1116229 RepID=S3D2G7_GLAL2|nr:Cytochrome P450 [Glarea lozoyensis ATCC 20868]EPE32020.1 Cytochrome P450 [Glarea lozoyensis ATCC 20868]